jgi:hypothetical protein
MGGLRHLQVRLSDEEYGQLQEAAGDVPLQRFARGLLLKGLGSYQPESDELMDGLTQAQIKLVHRIVKVLRDGVPREVENIFLAGTQIAEKEAEKTTRK